jgi:hypothetical protein
MGELESIAVGAAVIVGILTWNIRIGAVVYLGLIALILSR